MPSFGKGNSGLKSKPRSPVNKESEAVPAKAAHENPTSDEKLHTITEFLKHQE